MTPTPPTPPTPTEAYPLTWLYVPGDRPEVVSKALASGADVVVVDLEDAVAPDRKEYARRATADLLADPPPVPVHVRVNALNTPPAAADLTALAPLPGLSGLRLPKVTSPAQVVHVAEESAPAEGGAMPLYALLETALGVEQAYIVATAHPALKGIALGETDLRAELGVRSDTALDWPRSRVVLAARAASLPPPAQSIYPDTRDLDGLAHSCAHGRALGFLGRTAIHPRQLPVIERAYLPTREEIESAEEVLAAAAEEPGAQALPNGCFVDAAVVASAHRTLSLAQRAT
ncbi:CoA ester lyase [Streptomyces sp. KM273126]|uniref:HpcH/HpaI aldolase/citrate lyase family protein n=1 Tax=Streptomyces sp. KM273126 TaxID=2545247 RepID=UPI00103E2805|nr:CoA ester lyase [Streptomyces sp. KM273126]MBA2811989.1 CoA ester lyase [Streptomyces sp. KM273126]